MRSITFRFLYGGYDKPNYWWLCCKFLSWRLCPMWSVGRLSQATLLFESSFDLYHRNYFETGCSMLGQRVKETPNVPNFDLCLQFCIAGNESPYATWSRFDQDCMWLNFEYLSFKSKVFGFLLFGVKFWSLSTSLLLEIFSTTISLALNRVAKSAGSGEGASSIATDLIDSEDPKHRLFCHETAFVAIYAFFSGAIFPSFNCRSNILATAQSLEHIVNIFYG